MSKKIFISHAAKDKPLADALVDLLQTGININANDIFCSSLEGLGIPAGRNFIDHIKEQIQEPKVVVALLSQNYLGSQFCMCELGATWAMSHRLLPLLISPVTYQDVKGVLSVTQLPSIEDGLSGLMQDLVSELGLPHPNIERWDAKKNAFLKRLKTILKSMEAPKKITAAEHEVLKTQLTNARQALAQGEEEIASLKELVDQLSKLKDKEGVRNVKLKQMSAQETLDQLEGAVQEQLGAVSRIIGYVAFGEHVAGSGVFVDASRDRDLADQAGEAASKQLLVADGNGYFNLSDRHPVIKRFTKAFAELKKYIDSGDMPSELVEAFEETHDFPLSLENWDYWGHALDSRLSRISPP